MSVCLYPHTVVLYVRQGRAQLPEAHLQHITGRERVDAMEVPEHMPTFYVSPMEFHQSN